MTSRQAISAQGTLLDAVWIGRWHFLVHEPGEALLRLVDTEGTLLRSPLRTPDLDPEFSRLGVIRRNPAVIEGVPPFRVSLNEGGRWKRISPTPPPMLPSSSVAMNVLELGDVLLQTLVDQTSRRRIVRIFSAETGAVRSMTLNAPIVFHRTTSDGILWALRTTGSEEIARYTWRAQ